MSVFRRGEFYWYEFWFAGRRVRESSKSASKTVAQKAEKKRLRELEEGFNNVVTDARRDRIRPAHIWRATDCDCPSRRFLPTMRWLT
jgi:hypothetical protein